MKSTTNIPNHFSIIFNTPKIKTKTPHSVNCEQNENKRKKRKQKAKMENKNCVHKKFHNKSINVI